MESANRTAVDGEHHLGMGWSKESAVLLGIPVLIAGSYLGLSNTSCAPENWWLVRTPWLCTMPGGAQRGCVSEFCRWRKVKIQ